MHVLAGTDWLGYSQASLAAELVAKEHIGDIVIADSAGYYNRRFKEGYADYWPSEEYQRIAKVLSGLRLPRQGVALDFGCGNGSFSKFLADSLPGWQVVGADLSRVAVENAARSYSELTFVTIGELSPLQTRFHLIFSHHVLEHVHDLAGTWDLFRSLANPDSAMLHVLPCGNPGSFEYRLCALRRDGIDARREGRFYCDDGPHVRRLSSAQMRQAAANVGFSLVQERYASHYWGQIWQYSHKNLAYLRELTDWRLTVSRSAALKMLTYRVMLMVLAVGCLPTYFRWRMDPRRPKRWSDYLLHAVAISLTPISLPMTRFLRFMAEREWQARSGDPTGSEMFVAFVSSPAK